MLTSGPCRQDQLESYDFQRWVPLLGERPLHLHRKVWEYCYITQALHERGLLRTGQRGLGFAVGREPLASFFASQGCEIVATDLETAEALEHGWVTTHQHAAELNDLNERGLCPIDEFAQRVTFSFVDMRDIPSDLRGFDFIWSACSLEHLGSLAAGEKFIWDALDCLKSGGIAVHTTEFNVSSDVETVGAGLSEFGPWQTALYRKQDLDGMAQRLRAAGHSVADLSFEPGSNWADDYMDLPPYTNGVHLRLMIEGFVATSYGLIIHKAG